MLAPLGAGAAAPAPRTSRTAEQQAALTSARKITKRAAASKMSGPDMAARAAALKAGAAPKIAKIRQLEDDTLNMRSKNPALDAAMADFLQAEVSRDLLEADMLEFDAPAQDEAGRHVDEKGNKMMLNDASERLRGNRDAVRSAEGSIVRRADDLLKAAKVRLTPRQIAVAHFNRIATSETVRPVGDGTWEHDRRNDDKPWRSFQTGTLSMPLASKVSGFARRQSAQLKGWSQGHDPYNTQGTSRGVPELEATFGPDLSQELASLGGHDTVIDIGTSRGNIALAKIGKGVGARVIGVDLVDQGASTQANPRFSFLQGNVRGKAIRTALAKVKARVLIDAFGATSYDQHPDQVFDAYAEILPVGGKAFIELPPEGRYLVYPKAGGMPIDFGTHIVNQVRQTAGWNVVKEGRVERVKTTNGQSRTVMARVLIAERTGAGDGRIGRLSPLTAVVNQPSSINDIPMLPRAYMEQ